MGENCHEHAHTEIPSYWHALDDKTFTNNNFSASQLSVSTPPFNNQLDSIRARIMQGATNVELGFTGTGKGGAQNLTPDTLGLPERTAIKEIAKINDVGINSVHSAMSIQGLAGFSQSQFSEDKRSQDIEEVKRTIDFASDVTDGGAIVVHTGEFPYSIKREHGEKPFITKKGKKIKISEHGAKEKSFPILFVDKYDGNISSALRPDFQTFKYDDKDELKVVVLDDFEEDAKKYVEKYDDKEHRAQLMGKYSKFIPKDYKKNGFIDKEAYNKTFGNKYWLANLHTINISGYEEQARIKSHKSNVNKLSSDLEKMELDLDAREQIRNKIPTDKFVPHDVSEVTIARKREELIKLNEQLEIEKLHVKNYDLSVAEKRKKIFDSIPIEEYGKQKTSESIAELALHAREMTKKKKLKNPLFVAPENLWDGYYGAHPEDLRRIITSARKEFVEKAVNNSDKKKKMSEREAKKAAKDHIKATFDIGHANIWRKYFGGDEKEFKQWLGSEVNKLTKEGIIGHVHVSDNFGYNDEHLPPGYGNAPIKEFMTHLKKGKYKGNIIIEPGHHDAFPGATTLGMQHLETPIYRLHNQTSTWADVSGSYFGQTYIPSFITPDYLPNVEQKQGFTWSELPLE